MLGPFLVYIFRSCLAFAHTHSQTLTHSLSLSHTLTHSLSRSHTLTHSLSLSHTLRMPARICAITREYVLSLANMCYHSRICAITREYVPSLANMCHHSRICAMGWLRWVGCLKIQVSLQNTGLFCRALLQKRPIFLSILLIVATPYHSRICAITREAAAFNSQNETYIYTIYVGIRMPKESSEDSFDT